ncbi:MAG: thioredoxin fold domain-containing protein [Gammaproteobacteria bacterium]|nr:thioredoxin fold domain-containing protein [Gammaproteobacteria bacterium]
MRLSRFSFIPILVLVFYSQIAVSSVGRDPAVYFFNETWGNFQEELVKAREEGKKGILLFFEIDICPFCHRMKRTVLNQPEVQDYFRENFLIFSVDVEGDVEIVDFDGKIINQNVFSEKVNRVRATPVFMFYDLEGKPVVRFTGPTSGVQEFMWLGEYFVGGHYKKLRFTKFKRQKKKAARQAK